MDKKFLVLVLIYIVVGSICVSLLWNKDMIADELAHAKQIRKFIFMDATILPSLTVFPFYHYVISDIAKIFFVQELIGYRIITTILLIGLLYVFYKLSGNNVNKTILFYFFPIIFMYFFLVYTDLFSLMLVLFMFYFMFTRNYILSSIFGLLSIFTRQNNFIWLLYVCIYLIWENRYKDIKIGIETKRFKTTLQEHFKRIYPYLTSLFLFGLFILFSKTVVIGDKAHHQIGIYFNNIWFIMFCFVLIFMPYCVNKSKEIYYLLKNNKLYWLIAVIPLIGAIFFNNKHEYNQIEGIWFNILLQLVHSNIFVRILFFLIVLYGIYVLILTKFNDKKDYLIYPFSVLFLSLSQMVEVRYYIIPFTLFLLFKEEDNNYVKWLTVIYTILIAVLLFFTLIKT